MHLGQLFLIALCALSHSLSPTWFWLTHTWVRCRASSGLQILNNWNSHIEYTEGVKIAENATADLALYPTYMGSQTSRASHWRANHNQYSQHWNHKIWWWTKIVAHMMQTSRTWSLLYYLVQRKLEIYLYVTQLSITNTQGIICISLKGGNITCAFVKHITRFRELFCIKLRIINKKEFHVEVIGYVSVCTMSIWSRV